MPNKNKIINDSDANYQIELKQYRDNNPPNFKFRFISSTENSSLFKVAFSFKRYMEQSEKAFMASKLNLA